MIKTERISKTYPVILLGIFIIFITSCKKDTNDNNNNNNNNNDPVIPNCGTVTDVDGNTYNTVLIFSQCWLRTNLKTTKYRNNSNITLVSDNTEWENNTTGAYSWYDNNEANKATYGAFYNWYALNNAAGLCPTGWRVPTDEEWTTLTDTLGGINIAGSKLKEAGTTHWITQNADATNQTGFTALPGGDRNFDGGFFDKGYYGFWWSATQSSTSSAWGRGLDYLDGHVGRNNNIKSGGFSVRCIKE